MSNTGTLVESFAKKHRAIVRDMEYLFTEAVNEAYEQGWREAAKWSRREDLIYDIGSPAYTSARCLRLLGIQTTGIKNDN